jgi:methionyl-tRNA formyltransferase
MKLIFCGTPQFAVPSLEKLAAAGFDLRLVVTQPDRPQGRGMELTASPVKQSALKLGFPVVQPDKIRKNEEFQKQLREINPDAIVVVGYGRIIPPWMLELPRFGNINVHGSLLPKYRGAAPIQWAIASGETVTGITTMRLDEGLDTGGILLQREMPILSGDTAVTLAPRLAALGADLLLDTLHGIEQGTVVPVPQDHSRATLAPILKKEDGLIDFSRSATEIHNRLRGFQPWPGAYTSFRGKNLKIVAGQAAGNAGPLSPGELRVAGDRLLAGCGSGTALELMQVQLEGKRAMAAREFVNGYGPKAGEKLGRNLPDIQATENT